MDRKVSMRRLKALATEQLSPESPSREVIENWRTTLLMLEAEAVQEVEKEVGPLNAGSTGELKRSAKKPL